MLQLAIANLMLPCITDKIKTITPLLVASTYTLIRHIDALVVTLVTETYKDSNVIDKNIVKMIFQKKHENFDDGVGKNDMQFETFAET